MFCSTTLPFSMQFIHIIVPQNIARYWVGELYLINSPQNFSRHSPVTENNLYIDPVCLYTPLANSACKGTPANPQSYSCSMKRFSEGFPQQTHSFGYMRGICLLIRLAFCIGQGPMPKSIPQAIFFGAPSVIYAHINSPTQYFPAYIGLVDNGKCGPPIWSIPAETASNLGRLFAIFSQILAHFSRD